MFASISVCFQLAQTRREKMYLRSDVDLCCECFSFIFRLLKEASDNGGAMQPHYACMRAMAQKIEEYGLRGGFEFSRRSESGVANGVAKQKEIIVSPPGTWAASRAARTIA